MIASVSARMRRLTPLIAVASLLFAPAAARADGGATVIRDCLNHGHITGHYTQKQYAQALAELPADVAEYSDCGNLIRAAQLGAAGGRAGGGGGGGAANPLAGATATERAALKTAQLAGNRPLHVGGQLVRPGVVAVHTSSITNALPTTLLIALAALIAAALGLGCHRAWILVRTRR